ncbi:hypothetical protein OEZ86_006158 [Tetradesmus obliquus]|nr:hypothetical protein OEZ86_006158 [Tetradesmus obliquus]
MNFEELEGLLRPLLQQHLQVPQSHSEEPAAMELDAQDAEVPAAQAALDNLRKLVENHAHSTQGLQDVEGVPMPEVDEQLGPLQQEVEAVLQRLAGTSGLRKAVPALMSSALEQQLQALRPPLEDTAEAADQQAADGGDDSQQLEAAQQLHQAMKQALNKLPALRARLEEMEVRLGRNLEAFSAAQAQADKAPLTVERVLRGVAAGRGLAAAAGAEDSAADGDA